MKYFLLIVFFFSDFLKGIGLMPVLFAVLKFSDYYIIIYITFLFCYTMCTMC